MPFIQEIKRINEKEPFSFKVEFQLGTDSSSKPITRTEVWTAPEGLSKNEALRSHSPDSRRPGKVFKELAGQFKMICNKKRAVQKNSSFLFYL